MNEEEKAIKVITKRTKRLKDELEIEKEDMLDEQRIAYLIQEIKSNETVLNLLKKKDKQIEQYQNMLATNDMLHVLECEKKEKIIYLMANELSDFNFCTNRKDCNIYKATRSDCKECIKQYFERKVENGN